MRHRVANFPIPVAVRTNVEVVLTVDTLDHEIAAAKIAIDVRQRVFVDVVRLAAFQAVLADETSLATLNDKGLCLATLRRYLTVKET